MNIAHLISSALTVCHVFASALLRGRAVINMCGCFCESACVCISRMSGLCVSVPSVSRRHWKHDSRGMEKGGGCTLLFSVLTCRRINGNQNFCLPVVLTGLLLFSYRFKWVPAFSKIISAQTPWNCAFLFCIVLFWVFFSGGGVKLLLSL